MKRRLKRLKMSWMMRSMSTKEEEGESINNGGTKKEKKQYNKKQVHNVELGN